MWKTLVRIEMVWFSHLKTTIWRVQNNDFFLPPSAAWKFWGFETIKVIDFPCTIVFWDSKIPDFPRPPEAARKFWGCETLKMIDFHCKIAVWDLKISDFPRPPEAARKFWGFETLKMIDFPREITVWDTKIFPGAGGRSEIFDNMYRCVEAKWISWQDGVIWLQ